MSVDSNRPNLYGPQATGRYYGKYRGVVSDNVDPLKLGRILVQVPSVPDALDTWAMPCSPYVGEGVGFWSIPAIGATVWIEFEGGNPSYPVWVGGKWLEAEFPEPFELSPEDAALVKVWKTAANLFYMNDTPAEGGIKLEAGDPAVEIPVTMTFNSEGAKLNVGPCTIFMNPEEGITISMGENTSIMLTEEGIVMNAPTIEATAEEGVNVEAGAEIEMSAGADLTMDAAGAMELTAAGDASLGAAGGVEIEAGGEASMVAGGEASVAAGGALELAAGAEATLAAGAILNLAGTLITIN